MRKFSSALLVFILLVAVYVRIVNLGGFHTIRLDEEEWIVSGHFLLAEGIPKSWTVFWNTYGNYHYEQLGGKPYLVVQPYLDHPPLFSILIGSWVNLITHPDNIFSHWEVIRLPMIVISILTIIATSYLAKELFGKSQGILTLIAFSFLPSHIVTSKLIIAEHLLALLLISSLLILLRLLKSKSQKHDRTFIVNLSALSFIAVLSKLSGILVPLSVITLLLLHKKIKPALIITVATLLALLIFLAYGWHYDLHLFLSILQAHGQRPQTFWYFFTLFNKPDLGYYQVNDPLVIVGTIGSLMLALKNSRQSLSFIKSKYFLLIPWIFFSFIFVSIAPVELYGWYKYLLFPFIAIGIGWVWHEFQQGKVGWVLLLIPSVLVLMENVFLVSPLFNIWRRLIILILFGSGIFFIINKEKVKTKYYSAFVFIIILLTVCLEGVWGAMLNY